MITLGVTISSWFLSLFPAMPSQSVQDAAPGIASIASLVGSMSVWVNWVAVVGQIGVVLGLYFTFLGVKVLRAVFGHIPLFGGNG